VIAVRLANSPLKRWLFVENDEQVGDQEERRGI
jgi:hypothetical protein